MGLNPRRNLEVGDFIKCYDPDDAVNVMTELATEDIETDFVYERNGQKGIWLQITKIRK